MKRLLITGGTVFVSKFTAEWFKNRGYEVYVLNRGTRPQISGVNLICADRNNLSNILKDSKFDCIIDVCAYNREDVQNLLNGLGAVDMYILISSSAVYPETNEMPFKETQCVGANDIWGKYGANKIQAEKCLFSQVKNAYILRPPYLYGEYQNIYREPFVFDCAENKREFYIPKNGKMKLQFLHVEDLCRFIEKLLLTKPKSRIFNVGNNKIVDINEYVELCYKAVGSALKKVYVCTDIPQRSYFCFYDYEYALDVTLQDKLLPSSISLEDGIKREYEWYRRNRDCVIKKNYLEFIDKNLAGKL